MRTLPPALGDLRSRAPPQVPPRTTDQSAGSCHSAQKMSSHLGTQAPEGYDRPMGAAVPANEATPRAGALGLLRDRELIAAALLVAVLTPVAAGNGGYFPVAWGWAAIGFAAAALIGLVLQPTLELTHAERVTLAAWVALAAWTALSVLWSADVTQSVLEVERLLVYVGAAWALLVIGSRRSARGVLVAALLSVCLICTFSLGTHLLPERLGIQDRK